MGPPLAPPLGTAHPGGGRQGKREGLNRRPSADVGVPWTPDPGTRVPLLRAQSDHGHVLPGRPSGPAWMPRQPPLPCPGRRLCPAHLQEKAAAAAPSARARVRRRVTRRSGESGPSPI
ncbi:unnamed protein product [Rangifer tarandus platyrhynchus]|uniref:Uncharacterized protein n=2 Tax=Rangifer tarandus platyrhynchus TaxID=3082113 RepID=A0AC59ZJF3_RANTA|nr:unnamed protein product [Rangifer tarandus platyrhynchus]